MTLPFVSIVIPVYNVAPFINKCLTSVAEQTYHGKIETIIVDDCGQDQSIAIAENFISSHSTKENISYTIVHREKNGGLSAARNTGIDAARGDYIYFLDSDDYIIPEAIQLMMEQIEHYPGVDLVQAGAIVEGTKSNRFDMENSSLPEFINDHATLHRLYHSCRVIPMTAWNRLIRRDFVIKNELYFVVGAISEDIIWNFRLAQTLSSVAFLHINTYVYVYRPNSISTGLEYRKKIKKTWAVITSYYVDYCVKLGHVDNAYESYKCFKSIVERINDNTEDTLVIYLNNLGQLRHKVSPLYRLLIFSVVYLAKKGNKIPIGILTCGKLAWLESNCYNKLLRLVTNK